MRTFAAPPRKSRRHSKSGRFMIWILVVLLGLTGAIYLAKYVLPGPGGVPGSTTVPTESNPSQTQNGTEPETSIQPSIESTTAEPAQSRIRLIGVGDIIMHNALINWGLQNPGEQPAVYNYDHLFEYVDSILAEADLTMANFEGTTAGEPYKGFPYFSAPDAIADAMKAAGFDVVWTANNHAFDRGLDGMIRTASVFRERGFHVIGTRPDESSPADTVVNVGGIRIGLMAYTYETPGTETTKSLNGINMPAAADPLIDTFNPYRDSSFKADMAAMLGRAAALREQGAEFICLSLHWGNEYETRSANYQREMAQQLCDAGIGLILGHHPHVIQEIDILTSARTGQSTLVYYSLGNFLHNMDYFTHGSQGKAQDAIIARITLLKSQGEVSIELAEYIPTYVQFYPPGDGLEHFVVPVLPALDDPEGFRTNTKDIQASLNRIRAILSDSTGNEKIPVKEATR